MYNIILDKIKEFDQIAIFRHIQPDGDAVGSQLGLYTWLKDNFPAKEIKIAGFDTFDIYPLIDEISDDFINNSLAIVLDTANRERCDDVRFLKAKYIIKIDHHPPLDQYGDVNFVDTIMASTCEYLVTILRTFSDYPISLKAANYFYTGIFTDTISFKTNNTTAKSLRQAAYLAELGVRPVEIARLVENISLNDYELITKLRSRFIYEDGIAYLIMDQNEIKELNSNDHFIRNQVSMLRPIREIKIWAFIIETKEHHYQVSIRSKELAINQIANKYGGGGHMNASGIPKIKKDEIPNLLNEFKELLK